MDPPPLDGPIDAATLRERAGQTITAEGIGGERALKVFEEVLAPACISGDHPRYLSFIPAAPTEASILFDLVVGSSSFCANSWMEAAGAIFAENEALRWLSDLAGFPESSGGVFVSGGTAGNLSALVAARSAFRHRTGHQGRSAVLTSSGAHASIAQAGYVMDVDVMPVPGGPRLTGKDLTAFVAQLNKKDLARIFAVVGTSGTTNLGIIDDLEAIANICSAQDWWMHVDGAYGGAGLAAPSARPSFTALSEPIASSSILISGYLPPLTAAHCYTEIQSMRAPPTGSMVNTWRCSTTASGIPLITPITYPAGLEGYPFGSALQRMGRRPIAMPLKRLSARHTQPRD